MRIACVNQDAGIAPGRRKGAAVHLAELQRAFRAAGCDVLAVEAKACDAAERELARLHAAAPLDLVYERFAAGATGAARFCTRAGVPLFVEVNAPLLDENRERRSLAPSGRDLAAEDLVLASASAFFPVSTHVAAYLRGRGVEPARVHVTPNAVDAERFRPRSERPAGVDLPPQAFVVGFHGRLRAWHNFPLLVSALEIALALGFPVHLLAVGEGDFETVLSPRVARHATLLGWMDASQLAAHVACFDALPLTYAPDAPCYFSPLKLAEAMACGAVPIVPTLGDLPEAVEHGRCGLVYPAGDAHALANAIGHLIREPARRAALGRAAVARARAWTWADVAGAILSHVPRASLR